MQSPAEVQKKKKKKTTTKKKTKKKKSTFSISASFRVCDSQFDSASTKKKKKKKSFKGDADTSNPPDDNRDS